MVFKKKTTKKTSNQANAIKDLFVSEDTNDYAFVIGRYMASAFSGFIAGLIVCSLVWVVIIQSFLMS